jgi:hypothetical protein
MGGGLDGAAVQCHQQAPVLVLIQHSCDCCVMRYWQPLIVTFSISIIVIWFLIKQ